MHGQVSAAERLIGLWIMQQERAARASERKRRIATRSKSEVGVRSVAASGRYVPAGVSR